MSTRRGLTSDQLDALRAVLYDEMCAADAETNRLFDAYEAAKGAHGYGHHRTTQAWHAYLQHTGKSTGLSLALSRLDTARRPAPKAAARAEATS